MRIRDLKGLGIKSEASLAAVGINSVDDFMQADPFAIYAKLKSQFPETNRNFIYAIIGAQENIGWQDVAKTRKSEILMRLDDIGLAPK